ncbi:MAG: D-alanyl-D-alanine carboxypeptidase [Microbacteriaceae bacterium]
MSAVMRRHTPRRIAATVLAIGAMTAVTACTGGGSGTTTSAAPDGLSDAITAIMEQPRYDKASWSIEVTDLDSGKSLYSANPDRLAFTGSTRKLFSVGLALKELGADHRTTTSVYRSGPLDGSGVLHGDLNLVGAGDLTFGGRRTADGGLAYTDFDHNDANNLGTAILTPQDPLAGVDQLAQQVKASGIHAVDGNVAIDDRLFPAYRVPNNDLLITPTMVNENMVDVTITPTTPGQPAKVVYRPESAALKVVSTVLTTAEGTEPTVTLPKVAAPSGQEVTGLVTCVAQPGCTAQVTGTIPVGYTAPLSGEHSFVGTFRVEDPASYARTTFIEALERAGVTVSAPAVAPNPSDTLPASTANTRTNRVASLVSPEFGAQAKLILKVSLNLGANLALTQFGLAHREKTLADALATERKAIVGLKIPSAGFDFPTNGSGSPDSRATPTAIVDMLTAMSHTDVADTYKKALPILGVNGSLAHTGTDMAAKGHVYGKTGTTITGGKLEAQTLAGYVDTAAGHRLAFAICLNDYGPIGSIEDVTTVFTDEAAITNALYKIG